MELGGSLGDCGRQCVYYWGEAGLGEAVRYWTTEGSMAVPLVNGKLSMKGSEALLPSQTLLMNTVLEEGLCRGVNGQISSSRDDQDHIDNAEPGAHIPRRQPHSMELYHQIHAVRPITRDNKGKLIDSLQTMFHTCQGC